MNAVLPGLTDTKFASAITSNPKIMGMMMQLIPLNRSAQPNEIAPAVIRRQPFAKQKIESAEGSGIDEAGKPITPALALEFLSSKLIDVSKFITNEYKTLEAVPQAFELDRFSKEYIKGVAVFE